MKKRTYKRIQNRLYREIKARMIAEGQIAPAREKAEFYQKRFREFGSNVETIDLGKGDGVALLKWEIKPEPYVHYTRVDSRFFEEPLDEKIRGLKGSIIRTLVEGLIENDMVQFYVRGADVCDPYYPIGTIGAKLYVVPWEKVPHAITIKEKQYVEDVLRK